MPCEYARRVWKTWLDFIAILAASVKFLAAAYLRHTEMQPSPHQADEIKDRHFSITDEY